MTEYIDFAGVVAFVAKRRKPTGGYGATPRLPATLEDTFEVIAISRDLAILAPGNVLPYLPETDPELHAYLRQAEGRIWPGLRTTCQLLRACRFLGLPVDQERVRNYITKHRAESDDLHTSYYTDLIASTISPNYTARTPGTDIPFPRRPTVKEVRMYLTLRKLAGETGPPDHADLLIWLRRCQNGDGGFGFFPGTTSFIENSHHALAALAMLKGNPAEPAKARRFVQSCQTGRGGFGRSLRAAPFLDSTWHALACLRLLS